MEVIDQATFNFSPKIGLAVAVMVGFLVFAVALDLTWDQFRRVLKKPKAPGIGLLHSVGRRAPHDRLCHRGGMDAHAHRRRSGVGNGARVAP